MPQRHVLVTDWGGLGPALRGLDADLTAIETAGVGATGDIDASQIKTGVVNPARLGTGTSIDATVVLHGDGTWKTPTATTGSVAWVDVTDKPTFATVATTGAYADLTGKPDLTGFAPKVSPTFTGTVTVSGATVVGLTKATVGLGNVDNTSDATKTFTAAQITSGVFSPARLGTGTASNATVLYGDGTWKAAPTGTNGGGVGTDITIKQYADGTWPTITRTTGAHYRWLCIYDATVWPTLANGAYTGDELVGADASLVP